MFTSQSKQKLFFLLLLLLIAAGESSAQSIGFEPPEDFRSDIPAKEYQSGHILYLKTFFPECMIGDSLNINCSKIKNTKKLEISYKYRIEDISWIKYFSNLTSLSITSNYVSILPDSFPAKLNVLNLTYNRIKIASSTDFPVLPNGLDTLILSYQREDLAALPELPDSLVYLAASSNKITQLPAVLPNTLKTLILRSNAVSSINPVADSSKLVYLDLAYNKITEITALPATLKKLYLEVNELNAIATGTFPGDLEYLDIRGNNLRSLPLFGAKISEIYVSSNELTSLPALPAALTRLDVSENLLGALPSLPAGLTYLKANNNTLAVLPELPAVLTYLNASGNNISSIPELPSYLSYLFLANNNLSGNLSSFPAGLVSLYLENNQISSLTLPDNINILNFSGNNLHAFPYKDMPATLAYLYCTDNNLDSLPLLPEGIISVQASGNNFDCLPNLPASLNSTDIPAICGKNCWIGGYGPWDSPGNWSNNTVPGTNDDVIVLVGNPIINAQTTIKTLDIRRATIAGEGDLNVTGPVNNLGGSVLCNLKLSGSSQQPLQSAFAYILQANGISAGFPAEYHSLTVNNSAGVILHGQPKISTLSVAKGFIDLNGMDQIIISRVGFCANSTAIRNGEVIYMDILDQGWTFMGTMMKEQKLSNLNESVELGFGNNKQSIFGYDGTITGEVGWTRPSGLTANFPVGKGYRVYNFTSTAVIYKGVPFTGTRNLGVTYNSAGYQGGGWNLVANPYLSSIDWAGEGWTKTNIDNAIYIWNPGKGTYSAWINGTSQNEGSNIIAPGQAFFVKASAANPSLIITENAKSEEYRSRLRLAQMPVIRVLLSDMEDLTDELVIKIEENSSNNFDSQYDALKWTGFNHNVSLTANDGKDLSIASIPEAAGTFPLKVSYQKPGNYTFKFVGLESLGSTQMFLIDELMQEKIPVENETEYTFSTSTGDLSRFRIGFENLITGQNSSQAISISVYPNPAIDYVTIDLKTAQNAELTLTGPLGQEISKITESNKSLIQVPLGETPGIYHLKVKIEEKSYVYKIVKL